MGLALRQEPEIREFELLEGGIYAILNIVNNKVYVGSAIFFKRRWSKHLRYLNKNNHYNKHLQLAWLKYGAKNFIFVILEYIENHLEIKDRERHWISKLKSYDREFGYNILKTADTRLGILHTEEAKAKMSKTRKGKIKSPEWQANIIKAITGKKRTIEQKLEMSRIRKGKRLSNEVRVNMAKGQLGRKHSEESKLKRSILLKGKPFNNPKKNPKHSEETKAKMSLARKKYLRKTNNDFWASQWL